MSKAARVLTGRGHLPIAKQSLAADLIGMEKLMTEVALREVWKMMLRAYDAGYREAEYEARRDAELAARDRSRE